MNKLMMKPIAALMMLATVAMTISCGEDETTVAAPSASFKFEVDAENTLLVNFSDNSKDGATYSWDFGDNAGTSTEQNPSYTYAAGGTYTVVLTVTNDGGSDESTKDVTVVPPAGGDVITDGDMSNESAWTVTAIGAPNATVASFEGGVLTLSNGTDTTQSNIAVWQAIEVEAGDYLFSADATGTGAANSWLEFYFGSTAPEDGADYTDGGSRAGMSTWNEGCATAQGGVFDGNIVEVGCEGDLPASAGVVTFDAAGTVYLVIKSGSWDGTMGAGFVLDNISLEQL